MRNLVVLLVFLEAISGSAAQVNGQIRLSAAGGISYPVGDLANDFNNGWHVQASAGLGVPLLPVGVRLDAAYNRFPNGSADYETIAGSINAIINVPSVVIVPYLIGGAGIYNSRVAGDAAGPEDETTHFGANAGGGLRITVPGLAVFVEARLHNIFSDGTPVRYVPFSVGIHF